MIPEKHLQELFPLASLWIEEQEAYILKNGSPLNPIVLKDAQLLGITLINKVRVLPIEDIPLPANELLRRAITELGFIGKDTIGISFRYGIFVKTFHQNDNRLLFHELTHTMQYERVGGILPFLTQYVKECIEFGYPNGPLEQEAIKLTDMIYPS